MAMFDEIKEQTVKLKDMNWKQRADYIWHYYKWWIIGIIGGIICLISIISSIIENSKPTYLHAEFLNSNLFYEEYNQIDDDFAAYAGIDTNKTPLFIITTTVLNSNSQVESAYSEKIRILAEYSANELDVVCGPESVLLNDADIGAYGNLEEILPDGMLDELISKGYEPFYYTETPDDEKPDETITYIGGIYIDNCPYLNKQGEAGAYTSVENDRPVLTIAVNTTRLENAIQFIKFLTQ